MNKQLENKLGHAKREIAALNKKLRTLQAECEKLRRDAGLYRALRAMNWYDSPLAVVRNPKEAVKPGHDCPSGERLDAAIDAAMETTK